MVAALARPETIFSVLGEVARHRSDRSLTLQALAGLVTAVLLVLGAPHWWPVAALVLTVALHGGWGILERRLARTAHFRADVRRALLVGLASLGVASAVVGVAGAALVAFTGTGRSPYDACGPRAPQARCRAYEHPRRVDRLPLP